MAEGKDDVIRKMAVLRDGFEARLGDRLGELHAALEGVKPDGDAGETRRSLETLRGLSHKLRGGAGTFGLGALSEIAGHLEDLAEELLNRSRPLVGDDRDALLRSFSSLEAAAAGDSGISITDAAAWESLVTAGEIDHQTSKTVILVDDDTSFVEVLRDQLTHFGFDMVALADHAELRDAVVATPPAAVIMDVAFPGDFDAGLATIRALKDEGAVSCPVVFLSVRSDLPARLSAVRAGCDGYIVKPVDLVELVDILNRLTKRVNEDAFRVVVVDDDPEVAEFNAALLTQAGMETAMVTDPMKVMAPIRELRPDVILMDIQMPGCSGLELAKVIRQDKAFVQMPIVFLTGSDIRDAWRRAMQSGADEFLRKDIDPTELVSSVLARARRARDLSSVITRLGESEGRFRAVAESAREAIVTADEKGRIVYWNGGARHAFGYENTEILGRSISMLMPETYREAHEATLRRVVSDKKALARDKTIEAFGVRKDGGEFPIEISLADWRIGSQTYFTGIIRDITGRRHAEEAFRAVSEEQEAILRSTPTGIAFLKDRRFVSVNPHMEALFGWSVEELLGQSTELVFPSPDEYEAFGAVVYPKMARGEVVRIEQRLRRKDASIFWCRLTGQLIDANDPAKGVIVILDDISHEKGMEKALRESEEKLREVFGAVPLPVIVTRQSDGLIVFANDSIGRFLDIPMEDIVGQPSTLFYENAGDRDRFIETLRAHGRVRDFELLLMLPDGAEAWISINAEPMVFDGEPALVSGFSDITGRKRAEEVVRESEERYRFFVDNVEEGVALSENGKIIDISDVGVAMFGYERDEIIGRNTLDLTAPSMRAVVEHLIAEGHSEPYESELMRKDGSIFPALVRGRPLDLGGREVRLTTALDITKHKEAEAALMAAKTDADRANRAKSEFLSSMSHELRTPLNAILGFSQLLETSKKGALTDRQKDQVQYIRKGGEHLLELIDEVLDLARIEAGKLSLSIAAVDVRDLVDDCLSFAKTLAAKRDIVIEDRTGDSMPALWVDHLRSKQALLNLLSNAVKYNLEGGRIWLDAEQRDGRVLRIGVTDTGPGIPQDKQSDLFQPFSRLGAEATEIEGTGIGLVLTRKLVEEMGGTMGFKSTPGEGSTFWVDFPIAEEEVSGGLLIERRETVGDLSIGPNERLLLYVEDNPANLALMEDIVEDIPNLAMISTHTAELGLALAEERKPDVIILDINLPGMDGIEAARHLKKSDATREIPVLALSANVIPSTIERGRQEGFRDYLTKPVDISQLMAALRNALGELS